MSGMLLAFPVGSTLQLESQSDRRLRKWTAIACFVLLAALTAYLVIFYGPAQSGEHPSDAEYLDRVDSTYSPR